nr:hypothetical protein OG499_33810 [Streptomyces anulatus]
MSDSPPTSSTGLIAPTRTERGSAGSIRPGWQKLYKQAEDELLAPRALALPDWETLIALADALVAASHDEYRGWGEVVIFAACTAARIGEISGCRVGDIDTTRWVWTVRRPTTPAPGGLTDKGTKGKRARKVPIVEEIRPLVAQRYLHPDVRKITAAGAALSAHFNVQRAPRSLPGPIVMTRCPADPVKDAGPSAGPQLVPKNDQGPVSDCSETGPDLRLPPVGTTGFEPATP